uniref:3'-5' exonuclease domain-containing protein n=1 Tax=Hordeum vulgare subsp. vulgare TaxID=112509 RepID=A0A8I6Y1T4_HORVV
MGLDLEYTANQEGVIVIQLCFSRNVTVFQWSSSDKHCPVFMDFLRSGIRFASVDIRNDKLKMRHTFGIEIRADSHIDIQDIFRLEHMRTSMTHMAVDMIDEEYTDMKAKFPLDQHKEWETTPLDGINIEYATKDAYVAYELYRRIRITNYGQRHLVHQAAPPPIWGYSDLDE